MKTGTPKSEIAKKYREALPNDSKASQANQVGQVLRFLNEVRQGDEVTTYDPDRRLYLLGKIESDSEFRPDLIPELPNARQVAWTHGVPRDTLTVATRKTLGAIQTLFRLGSEASQELRSKAKDLKSLSESDSQEEPEPPLKTEDQRLSEQEMRRQLLEQAEETVGDRIASLDWDDMQELVAGILRAMGYRTRVSPKGSDRGVDIFASPDGLGLEEPRIFVEVKHRPKQAMGSQAIRSFLGGRSAGDKCLFVSTGGFTQEARYEADRANVALTLISMADLRKLLVDYYEKLDSETRGLVPLTKTYVPAD